MSVTREELGKLTSEVSDQTAGEIREAIKAAAPVTGEQLATWCQSERPEPSEPAPKRTRKSAER